MTRQPSHEVPTGDGHFEAVLAAARVNDGWAFDQLFRMFAPRVTGYLRARGAVEPDEVTNDVFISAFRSLDKFEGNKAAFRSWVFTIARNRLVDERRRQARQVPTVGEELADIEETSGGDVEEEALANIGGEWVLRVLAPLAPDQRDVMLLRLVADLTVDQIAETLGKRPGAVKSLQRRGIAAIKRQLRQQGVPLTRPLDV